MQLWRKLCTVLTIVLLLGVVLLNQFGSPLTRYAMERDVMEYLQTLGYAQQDVQAMKAVYNKNDQNPYMVEVTFMDAPQQVHYYVYDDNRELQEIEKNGK